MSKELCFVVHEFMLNEKKLSGNELMLYAYLYSHTGKGSEVYRGGYKSLSQILNITPPTTYNVLAKLRERGLLQYDDVSAITVVV